MNLYNIIPAITLLIITSLTSCKKFIAIDPPVTELVKETVFESDATAKAAVTDIYAQMRYGGFASGSTESISFFTSLCSDESINYVSLTPEMAIEYNQFNTNNLLPDNYYILQLWSDIYKCIYKTNAVLEGLNSSNKLTDSLKAQLAGEAKFLRSFCYFYLINMWGDVPLITSTDYIKNNTLSKTSKDSVYLLIVKDLNDAKILLRSDYSFSNNERVRVNSGAASALLARVYLYIGNWESAESEATKIIENLDLYGLVYPLTEVFRGTSKEVIWQIWSDFTPPDRSSFFVSSAGPSTSSLRESIATSFDLNDARWTSWGRKRIVNGVTYYYTLKYLSFSLPPLDYSTVLRLSEQYLIRAEARCHLGKVTGGNSAETDINTIRTRAGLADTSVISVNEMLDVVALERKHELFTEWGHRWFDLKRTGKAGETLGSVKPNWSDNDTIFPIPETQIINNPAVKQNKGY